MIRINSFEVRTDMEEGYSLDSTKSTWIRTPEELRSAIRQGDYQDAIEFISTMDENSLAEPDNHGQTALHWAAYEKGPEELCKGTSR